MQLISPAMMRGILAFLVIGLITVGGYTYWRHSQLFPSTDNAYLRANVVRVAPLVAGAVLEVPVHDNQKVKTGDVLLRIDPAPYDAALKSAQARLTVAQQQQQQSNKGSTEDKNIAKANVDQAQAGVTQAQLNVDYTTVKAPVDGIVGDVAIRPGAIVQAGVSLFPLVDTSQWWIDANFKETDLTRISVGQNATVSVDIYPAREFKGKVESLSPASGVSFSLLPPENATGNWVKVTQRFPVRISLETKSSDPQMRVGASASVTVDTSGASRGSNH
jgi:membrane fusion protein (multidrug efflux system)